MQGNYILFYTESSWQMRFCIAVGRVARGKAAFADLTHPRTPALAGASVGARKVLRFGFAAGVYS